MAAELTLHSRVQARNTILSQKLDDDTVMANIESGFYFGVNRTSRRIWELLAEPTTIAEICLQLQAEYEVDAATCEMQALEFVRELSREGLVEECVTCDRHV